MRIVKAVVDELPKSASRCRAAKRTWNQDWAMESVYCELNFQTVLLDTCDFVRRRCPNCPLVGEAEEVQERNEQNESFSPVMGSGDGLGWQGA